MTANSFEHDPTDFIGVPIPSIVYVGMKSREDFDRIALPATDHGEDDKGHVLSKALEQNGVRVIFQYWIKSRTAAAIIADHEAERASKRKHEPKDTDVQCPACRGQGAIRGPQSDMPWHDCRYCEGSGGVSEERFHAWHDTRTP